MFCGAPIPTGCAGHVAWVFAILSGTNDFDVIAGSTEN